MAAAIDHLVETGAVVVCGTALQMNACLAEHAGQRRSDVMKPPAPVAPPISTTLAERLRARRNLNTNNG